MSGPIHVEPWFLLFGAGYILGYWARSIGIFLDNRKTDEIEMKK